MENHTPRGDIEENDIYDEPGEPNNGGGNVQVDDVHRIPVGGTAEMRCQIIGTTDHTQNQTSNTLLYNPKLRLTCRIRLLSIF